MAFPFPSKTKNSRRFPRAGVNVKVRLTSGSDKAKNFEATLRARDISVGGIFFESTFFLKVGQLVNVEFKLPPRDRQVRALGRVVRVESMDGSPRARTTGFALKFEEYYGASDVVLANYFLADTLREFIVDYAARTRTKASAEYVEQVVDILAAWELSKMNREDGTLWHDAEGGPARS